MAQNSDAVNRILLALADGDEEAYTQLISMFEPLICSEVLFYARDCDAYERESFEQEALLALVRAAKSYKVEQDKVTFGLFAKICICRALKAYSQKLSRRPETTSLDKVKEDNGTDICIDKSVEDIFIENERVEYIYRAIEEALSDYELLVFNLHIDNNSVSDIAKKLCKSEKSVANTVNRFRKKIRELL